MERRCPDSRIDDAARVIVGAPPDGAERRRRAAWVLREIMPHEPGIRLWLRRRGQSAEDIDDLIQEAYAKLAGVTASTRSPGPTAISFGWSAT